MPDNSIAAARASRRLAGSRVSIGMPHVEIDIVCLSLIVLTLNLYQTAISAANFAWSAFT